EHQVEPLVGERYADRPDAEAGIGQFRTVEPVNVDVVGDVDQFLRRPAEFVLDLLPDRTGDVHDRVDFRDVDLARVGHGELIAVQAYDQQLIRPLAFGEPGGAGPRPLGENRVRVRGDGRGAPARLGDPWPFVEGDIEVRSAVEPGREFGDELQVVP